MQERKAKFKVGDKVVLKDFDFMCENRKVSPANEKFQRHYKYMKGKEPLEINWIWKPGEMTYSEDCDNLGLRGKVVGKFQYNIHTPLSKMYLFGEEELELYEGTESD